MAKKQADAKTVKYIIIADPKDIEDMKDLSYWNRLTIKDAFAEAIADYKAKYVKKNGPLKNRPK